MTAPSIRLQNVSLNMAGNQILDDVTCTLDAGRLHVLIGPNGAGKTSLLKTMLGLFPHHGKVERVWPGNPVPAAYIPQQPRFDTVLPVTVRDYLIGCLSNRSLIFKPTKKQLKMIAPLLETVGLSGKEHLQLGKLSGGERQRLMFAQALSLNSPLWFLDEPTTGLDTQGIEFFTDVLARLKEEQKTLIMVHHDMEFVKSWADNILIIDGGLKSAGTPDEIFSGRTCQEAPVWTH